MRAIAFLAVPLILVPYTASAKEPLHVHMISGSKEYKSEPSLKEFSKLLTELGARCTVSWGRDGVKKLEGLENIRDADVLLVFARRMKLADDQMELIRAHWKAGKPIVGIRTASHAFQKADNEVFDRRVLGNRYSGHYGNEPVKVTATEKGADHPVLRGVGAFTSRKLYKAGELAKTSVVLQMGDNGKGQHAVTLINEYKGGRTFYTSLGVQEDFRDNHFLRMLVNAIYWVAKRDAPAIGNR